MRRFSYPLFFVLLCFTFSNLRFIFLSQAQTLTSSSDTIEQTSDALVNRLSDLTKVYEQKCIMEETFKKSPEQYLMENGLSEECWKLLTEINHFEGELKTIEAQLEEELRCQGNECYQDDPSGAIGNQLKNLSQVNQKLSCNENRKKEIINSCSNDMSCALTSSVLGLGGHVAEFFLSPKNSEKSNCDLGNDSCITQLATGFVDASITFFKGSWDLLKIAGQAAKSKMSDFWNWISGAEDHSSTSQLALASASEDPGIFKMLTEDFSGTMKKIWQALVMSLKEWLKNDIFCEKWEGIAHFSHCLAPAESFDCLSCKSMINGLCAISGYVVAEVVPSFLTGGLVTAAKYGMQGAKTIAKSFKVSDKALSAIKNSKVGKLTLDKSAGLGVGIKRSKDLINASLTGIRRYLLSPSRMLAQKSFESLSKLSKQGVLYLAQSEVGKRLVFSAQGLKLAGKILLYPIDNPLTTLAYKAGERSFEKTFKLGAPQLKNQGILESTLISQDAKAKSLLIKIEEAKIRSPHPDLTNLERELLGSLSLQRRKILSDLLEQKQNIDFDEIIKTLYPELKYGKLASTLSSEDIIRAEKELWDILTRAPDSPLKTSLINKYNAHLSQGTQRAALVNEGSIHHEKILQNSKLSEEDRLKEALTLIRRNSLSPDEKSKLSSALKKAHLVGEDNGVFEYSWRELREKYQILIEGGFTSDEANSLIRAGLAGRPPARTLLTPGKTLFSGFAEDILERDFLQRRKELFELIRTRHPDQQRSLLQRLLLRDSVLSDEAQGIIDNYESLFFIDYQHMTYELNSVYKGHMGLDVSGIAQKYEPLPFENFKRARSYLLNEQPEISKETLLKIHKIMMEGGVENVTLDELAKIRGDILAVNVPMSEGLSREVLEEINGNPYLTWIGAGINPDGSAYGLIYYPNIETIRPVGLELISKNHPLLVKEIKRFQELKNLFLFNKLTKELSKEYAVLVANSLKLNKRLVEAMVDDVMDWFHRQRALIGEIDSPEKLDQYVDLLAKFQRDLVSIHPLANGNGRSTRELALSYALMKEGFPPPRIIDTNADMYKSLDEWKRIIKEGILTSDFLVDDLIERLKFGLPLESSTDLFAPYYRPPVSMRLKGVKNTPLADGVEYIDPRLYREILLREIKKDPDLKAKFSRDPIKAWEKVHEKVEETFSKNSLYYNHPKNGVERVALSFVDSDFKVLFGKASFDNKELFDFKMKTWYSEDITWRGLASKSEVKSEQEIIEMFSELTPHNASNAVVNKVGPNPSSEEIREAALEDFEKYNEDVFETGLVRMAKDHSETGPLYGMSYGYSTSKSRTVGKAFAMGAMVVGEYGAHKAPELQALLKSRVLVGARRANKDVDLGRLKQVREDFSYKYGRQQEVMGIGASDPDAVTIVQTLDAEGEVILSYLRNKNNPKEIFVVQGDIDPDDIPSKDQILKTIQLQKN